MEFDSSALAEEILAGLRERDNLSVSDWTSISARIQLLLEQVVRGGTQSQLKELEAKLLSIVKRMFVMAPSEVKRTLLDPGQMNPSITLSYALGEASFAQAFTSNMAARTAAEQTISRMAANPFARLLNLLAKSEKTNTQLVNEYGLAGLKGISSPDVSKNLAAMRSLGVSDVRRIGREAYNFLTPLGRDIAIKNNPAQAASTSPLRLAITPDLEEPNRFDKMILISSAA